ERTGADVAIDDTQRPQCQAPELGRMLGCAVAPYGARDLGGRTGGLVHRGRDALGPIAVHGADAPRRHRQDGSKALLLLITFATKRAPRGISRSAPSRVARRPST